MFDCIYVLFGECVVRGVVGNSQGQMDSAFWKVSTNTGSHFSLQRLEGAKRNSGLHSGAAAASMLQEIPSAEVVGQDCKY